MVLKFDKDGSRRTGQILGLFIIEYYYNFTIFIFTYIWQNNERTFCI